MATGALHVVYAIAVGALVLTMALVLYRAVSGPTVYDRIVALNAFGTKTVLLIAALGFLYGRPEWLDLAITYVLINFVGTLAVMRFSKHGSLTREAGDDTSDSGGRDVNVATAAVPTGDNAR
ncbi:MAG: monovalent cation/H+ antiporter complex subunit F [Myxococcota bacterium]